MADSGNRAPQAPQQNTTNDVQTAELNMRRALGLNAKGPQQTPQQRPEQARARHRFVQDGGVPVVVLNHRADETSAVKDRLAEVQTALENERSAHASTRRQLSEQQAAAQALQTRLAHAELAHREALAQEHQARIAAQEALAAALAAPTAKQTVPGRDTAGRDITEHVTIERVPSVRRSTRSAEPAASGSPAPEKPKRGRPRINPLPEPKPLRWWTPSFRAKTKA